MDFMMNIDRINRVYKGSLRLNMAVNKRFWNVFTGFQRSVLNYKLVDEKDSNIVMYDDFYSDNQQFCLNGLAKNRL